MSLQALTISETRTHMRSLMKNKYKNALAHVKACHLFNEYCNEFFGLPSFTIEILSTVHLKEAMHILCEQFAYTTKNASNNGSNIVHRTYKDCEILFNSLMKHAIKCGTCLVVMHNERVVGVSIGFDFVDSPVNKRENNESEPQSNSYWMEINYACAEYDVHRKLYSNWENTSYFGRIYHAMYGARLQSYSNYNIMAGIFHLQVMLIRYCGYEQYWSEMSHPITIRTAKCIAMQTNYTFISAYFDLSDYKFKREENKIIGRSSVQELLEANSLLTEKQRAQSITKLHFVIDFRSCVSEIDSAVNEASEDDRFTTRMMLFWKELVVKSKHQISKL